MSNKQAAAAIEFALDQDQDAMQFLRLWAMGMFGTIRRQWPDCPESVFEEGDEVTALREENKRLKDELKKIYETEPEGWQDADYPTSVGRQRVFPCDIPLIPRPKAPL